ncbi:MAG: phasin family protein [Candidatus Competibacteraceae bacterium]|nr:phasin family protein [Candidatus Competibacteraceae bacterium]
MTDKKPRPEDEIPARLMESAHQVWLAGLAVFEAAQREGGRLFDTLVGEGQTKDRPPPQDRSGPGEEPPPTMEVPGAELQGRTNETLERLERLFEDRLQRILARLHVPTREDILALERRIDELERELEAVRAARSRRPRAKGPDLDQPVPGNQASGPSP